ncbi:MAG: Uma2 family endonuclease [Kofleriaceae bacterium]
MLQILDGKTAEETVRVRPLRRREYEHLERGGAFEDGPVELLCGAMVEVVADCPGHDPVVGVAAARLRARGGAACEVRVKQPLPLTDFTVARPDLVVGPVTTPWASGRPATWLVVEVADASLPKDRGLKRVLYAQAGIEEYWVVDLAAGVVEAFARANARLGEWEAYAVSTVGEWVVHGSRPTLALSVDDLMAGLWPGGAALAG